MNVGKYQLLLWRAFRLGREPVPRSLRVTYDWLFWLGPLEIRKAARRAGRVDYSDEVTPEQVAAIDKLVAPEFATGDWTTVEKE